MALSSEEFSKLTSRLTFERQGSSTAMNKPSNDLTLPRENPQQGIMSDTFSDVKQIGTDIRNSFNRRQDNISNASGMEQGLASKTFQNIGQGFGFAGDVGGSVIKGGVKALLPQEKEDSLKNAIPRAIDGLAKFGDSISPDQVTDFGAKMFLKYDGLDEEAKKNVDASFNIGSLLAEAFGVGVGAKGVNVATRVAKEGIEQSGRGAGAFGKGVNVLKNTTIDAVDNLKSRVTSPNVSDATRVSLNPKEALKGTSQDIRVSVGGKMKPLSEITPTENMKLKVSTEKSLDAFKKKAEVYKNDRNPLNDPTEIVGQRVDNALNFADKKRQVVGQKMGDIEIKYKEQSLQIGDKVNNSFAETIRSFDNPKFGVDTADAPVVRKLVDDFDKLAEEGATIGDRMDFVRSWTKYLEDSKDAFGKFKENATANSRIQSAIIAIKNETVDAISLQDKVYKGLRNQYSTYKKLDEIGDALLGKDGMLGDRIKGGATVKRALKSNSDAGARQFLTKLKELTGYDAIKDGDLALTAMELVGDYQGLSLLEVLSDGKSGIIKKGLGKVQDLIVGNEEARIKNFIKKGSFNKGAVPTTATKGNIVSRIIDRAKNTPNKKGGFIRIGKDTPKTVQSKPKVSVSESLPTNLITEAKKYKTSEEFVKGQGTPVFRAGSLDSGNPAGTFLSTDRKTADNYQSLSKSKTQDYFISANAKIKTASTRDELLKELDPRFNKDTLNEQVFRDEQRMFKVNKENKLKGLPRTSTLIDGMTPRQRYETIIEKRIADKLKGKFDGVIYNSKNANDQVGEYQIFNKEVIKTKSQLEQIWKDSNKK